MAIQSSAATKELHPQVVDRTYFKARDQHGRLWGAIISKRTMSPVGSLEPQQWSAPFLPAPKYINWKYNEQEGNHYVHIDYDAMIRDREQALKDWNQRLVEVGLKVNGTAFDARKPSPEVLALVGPRPHPREIPLAAQAGEKWVLGLTDKKPSWAHKFFPEEIENPLWFLEAEEPEETDGETEATEPAVVAARPRGRPRKQET